MSQENKSKKEKIADGAEIMAKKADTVATVAATTATGLTLVATIIRLFTNKK